MSFSLTIFQPDLDADEALSEADDQPGILQLHEPASVQETNAEMRNVMRDIQASLRAMRALIRYERRGDGANMLYECRRTTVSHLNMLLSLNESITWNQGEIHLLHEGRLPDVDQPVEHNIPASEIMEVVREYFPLGDETEFVDTDLLEEMHDRICDLLKIRKVKADDTPGVDQQTWYTQLDGFNTDPDGNNTHPPALTRAA